MDLVLCWNISHLGFPFLAGARGRSPVKSRLQDPRCSWGFVHVTFVFWGWGQRFVEPAPASLLLGMFQTSASRGELLRLSPFAPTSPSSPKDAFCSRSLIGGVIYRRIICTQCSASQWLHLPPAHLEPPLNFCSALHQCCGIRVLGGPGAPLRPQDTDMGCDPHQGSPQQWSICSETHLGGSSLCL